MLSNSLNNKAVKQQILQLTTNGNKFALNLVWELLCYVLHLCPSLFKIRSNSIWMQGFGVGFFLRHSKLRGLETSGHLVTILCTLVSGFVFDFPNAGTQEVKLKRIDFLFKWCLQKIATEPYQPSLPVFPLGYFAAQHNTLSCLGSWGSEPSSTCDWGVKQGRAAPVRMKHSTAEAQS